MTTKICDWGLKWDMCVWPFCGTEILACGSDAISSVGNLVNVHWELENCSVMLEKNTLENPFQTCPLSLLWNYLCHQLPPTAKSNGKFSSYSKNALLATGEFGVFTKSFIRVIWHRRSFPPVLKKNLTKLHPFLFLIFHRHTFLLSVCFTGFSTFSQCKGWKAKS